MSQSGEATSVRPVVRYVLSVGMCLLLASASSASAQALPEGAAHRVLITVSDASSGHRLADVLGRWGASGSPASTDDRGELTPPASGSGPLTLEFSKDAVEHSTLWGGELQSKEEHMGAERPITQTEFESVVSAVRRAIATNQVGTAIPFADRVLVLGRTDDGGYTLGSPGAEVPMALFPEPSGLPRTYPPELPFVAGEFVTTGHSDGHLAAMWWAPQDSERLLEELHEQCVGRGWTLKDEARIPEQAVVQRSYAKDAVRRFITTSPGSITLSDSENAHGSKRTRSN